jgi:hypothetical protein
MTTTRRDLLTTVFAASGAAVTGQIAGAAEHNHDPEQDHQAVPSDPALRVKALESLLVATGLVDRAALDASPPEAQHHAPLFSRSALPPGRR